ncbi:NAD(P)/FAD-dependent oxidoreductase [Robertkochia solimangrovi]|uniref:NAD(P)/FAD-dependent oxidoreductase n=1 Tax=Robertkochia solimangrovi TaxID=2213046 RepID=UPI00117FB071|nr:FAD/NAD(P)-binding oxidoreductase [Robertkochia solimangrovi]TRZ43284.1 NAD(P)/FAD-dependent oxidoreductase [Robertkochia solimangrovi]
MKHIVIIGNGIAGITAARHIRKRSDNRISVISSENKYFFSRTALMYVYMGHMKFEHTQPYENNFWESNRIELVEDHVNSVTPSENKLVLRKGKSLDYDVLIIATGSKPNRFGWPGQNLKGVQGLYSKQDLELLEKNAPNAKVCKHAVITGGGLIGIELAEMLHSRKIPVTFLVRESGFWRNVLPKPESEMINRHIRKHGIDLRLNTELSSITGDENSCVASVITNHEERIPCDLVGLTAGVSPSIEFLKDSGIETNKGILVDSHLRTTIENIFAIGDCAELREPLPHRKAVEAVWYAGRMMGETVACTVCDQPVAYRPGHWFNSAKFFDIEYQTYGKIHAEKTAQEEQLYWESEDGNKCIRIAFEKETGVFIGMHALGVRLSHMTIDRWLTEKLMINDLLPQLEKAAFDPELFDKSLKKAKAHFQQKMIKLQF